MKFSILIDTVLEIDNLNSIEANRKAPYIVRFVFLMFSLYKNDYQTEFNNFFNFYSIERNKIVGN